MINDTRNIKRRISSITIGSILFRNRLLLTFFIFAVFVECVKAQEMFYSPKVDSLYKLVNHTCSIDSKCVNDTILQCGDLIKGDTVPIIISKDENCVVDHIGFCFLPDSIRVFNISVIRFIEREMLAIMASKDISAIMSSYKNDGVQLIMDDVPISQSFLQNKKQLCNLLKGSEGIILNRVDKDYYVTICCSNGQRLSILFPADCELISGMDKKEQEIRLAFQLKNHTAKAAQSPDILTDKSFLQLMQDSIYQGSIYVEKGEKFSIPQINNDLFYFKNDSIFTLVSDTSLIALSFSNALLAPTANHYTIDVKHRMYGLVSKDYSIDSRDFNDYFSQGYERYFGIETLDPDHLSGTLILYNRDEEFIHLFYVTTTADDLANGGRIMMELYSNIPQHNIESLY